MSNRIIIILGGCGSSIIFLAIFWTNNYSLLGLLLGFITGIVNTQWLFRDSKKALNRELSGALKIYYISLFSRLGMITLVVATVARFRPEWLFYLAIGMVAGIIIPLILTIIKQVFLKGGEQ
jgi:hypothetical protein